MRNYKVHVCRIAYSHLDITVEANTPKQAMKRAEETAGNYDFPNENESKYEAQSATKLDYTFDGTGEVFCHHISFFYRSNKPIPESLHDDLIREALERASDMIATGCNQGELNYEDDKHSYTGWWKI